MFMGKKLQMCDVLLYNKVDDGLGEERSSLMASSPVL